MFIWFLVMWITEGKLPASSPNLLAYLKIRLSCSSILTMMFLISSIIPVIFLQYLIVVLYDTDIMTRKPLVAPTKELKSL